MNTFSRDCVRKLEELIEQSASIDIPVDLAEMMADDRNWEAELQKKNGHAEVLRRWITLGSEMQTIRHLSDIAGSVTARVASLLWADDANCASKKTVQKVYSSAIDAYKQNQTGLMYQEKERVADRICVLTQDVFALQRFAKDLSQHRAEAEAVLCRTNVKAETVASLVATAKAYEKLANARDEPHSRREELLAWNKGMTAVQSLPAEIQIQALHDQKTGDFPLVVSKRCETVLRAFRRTERRLPTAAELATRIGPKFFCDVEARSFARTATIVRKYAQ